MTNYISISCKRLNLSTVYSDPIPKYENRKEESERKACYKYYKPTNVFLDQKASLWKGSTKEQFTSDRFEVCRDFRRCIEIYTICKALVHHAVKVISL